MSHRAHAALAAAALVTLTACGGKSPAPGAGSTTTPPAPTGGVRSTLAPLDHGSGTATSPARTAPTTTPSTSGATSSAAATTRPATGDATLADLRSATIPPYCQLPTVTLVDGKTPKSYAPKGGEIMRTPAPVLVDVNGDGHEEAVGTYECSAGGVGWPQRIVVVGAGRTTLATYDLARDQREHATLGALTAVPGGVRLAWTTYDGAAHNPERHSGTLRVEANRPRFTSTDAPTPAGDTDIGSQSVSFASPSGGITCRLAPDGVRCTVPKASFSAPPKPTTCTTGDYGTALALIPGRKAVFACGGAPQPAGTTNPSWWQPSRDRKVVVAGREVHALGYGHRLVGSMASCVVSPDTGVSCRDYTGKHGFEVSRERYRVW